MYKRVALSIFLAVVMFSGFAFAESPADSFKKNYPNVQLESIKETQIDGLYEVVVQGVSVVYYHPKTGYVFVGEMRSKDGKSFTAERVNELVSAKVKKLPLEKAVKIGSGKNTIIEFTDPDCPYCRKMAEYFKKKEDMTRYIFFFPLTHIHPYAEDKAKYILCSKDKGKTYEEVMAGKIDSKKIEPCDDKDVAAALEEHKHAAAGLGVQGTPMFVVNGQPVRGANVQAIESLLKK
ncbi:MAG: DsbC family protein [Nitrospirae bacterium]|nr:DsbC family protein [Nitrospirota bacterium]